MTTDDEGNAMPQSIQEGQDNTNDTGIFSDIEASKIISM